MDRVSEYRRIIQEYLTDFAKRDGHSQLVFDTDRDRYLVLHNEWRNEYRIYGCGIHLDLIDGQIWIQNNSTEIYIDRDLIARGVEAKDIILGFRSPSIRALLAARQFS